VVDTETLLKVIDVMIKSCIKMRDVLDTETEHRCMFELICSYERTLLMMGFIILHLLKNNTDHGHLKVEKLFQEVYEKFPAVTSHQGYYSPLCHVLFGKRFTTGHGWLPHFETYQYVKLLKMFLDSGFSLDDTDSENNTMLHVCIQSLCKVEFIKLLLENGVHVHAKNKEGNTAHDILLQPTHVRFQNYTKLLRLMDDYSGFLSLKCLAAMTLRECDISYEKVLPRTLVRFVNLH
jgi:ankyrin repeat protein